MMTKLEFSAWHLRAANPAVVAAFIAAGVPSLVAITLAARGFKSMEDVERFATLSARDLTPPDALEGMAAALTRLDQAIAKRERVFVHGDFDADGVTSTAILMRGLTTLGVDATAYVPDRAREGHGLHASAVERACAAGASLIIAVDCGINDAATVALATSIGIDTVIVDHHELKGALPAAAAVIDPKAYLAAPDVVTDVSAAMLAYKVVWGALRRAVDRAQLPELAARRVLRECRDLAAVGTIADAMPLVGENRGLVRSALERMHQTESAGLGALVTDAREGQRSRSTNRLTERATVTHCGRDVVVTPQAVPVVARDISHAVAPVLNAFGRMGDATRAVALLTAQRGAARRAGSRRSGASRTRRVAPKSSGCSRQRSPRWTSRRKPARSWPSVRIGIRASSGTSHQGSRRSSVARPSCSRSASARTPIAVRSRAGAHGRPPAATSSRSSKPPGHASPHTVDIVARLG